MRWKQVEYSGWGGALKANAHIARPERRAALVELSAEAPAPAIGQMRSYGDAALNDGGHAIEMTRLNRVLAFDQDTGRVTVEAGMQIGDLGRIFAARGWIPPVMPGTGFATVGGCIAHDVHGKNHHVMGSFGQHLSEFTLLQHGKARKVTPDKTPDLFKASVGGLGQTGIIAEATIQLMPCPGDMMVLTERRIDGWDEFLVALDTSQANYTVGWIDATAKGTSLGRGVLEEGEITSGVSRTTGRAREVPFFAPQWALSAPMVRIFNEVYFRRVPASGRTTVKPISAPFFPLDKIRNWNRLYGRRGFHQFQCVVPIAAVEILREMLEMIAETGLASPLAVLKRMGPGRAGYMSFPMEGYTLAVDFPNRGPVSALFERLEQMSAETGGRVYFAKDALSGGLDLAEVYPDLGKWRKAVDKADPDRAMVTDLVRRLQLRQSK